jgi:hypothetical protein
MLAVLRATTNPITSNGKVCQPSLHPACLFGRPSDAEGSQQPLFAQWHVNLRAQLQLAKAHGIQVRRRSKFLC